MFEKVLKKLRSEKRHSELRLFARGARFARCGAVATVVRNLYCAYL